MKSKLIVALGNIGAEYEKTRHNMGFLLLDFLAREWGSEFSEKPKFKAYIAEVTVGDKKVILLKPTTFYNLSGEAVRAIKDFYKLENTDILVVHDELALPFGTIRARVGGSDAGNNGIKSVSSHIGEDYTRVRVGVANERLEQIDAADFVLSRFGAEEQSHIAELAKHTQELVESFVAGNLEHHTRKT